MAAFAKMHALKPDAYIMSDPGLIDLVRTQYPDAEIHLSVQANNTNWAQVKFWQKIGIKRIILSRELSLREVREIHENCPDMEIEFFVHGAICMAYSGRCLLSNYLSNRDPNQGTCAHSCRWQYKVFKEDVTDAELHDSTGRPDSYTPISGQFFLEEADRPGEFLPIDEDEYGTYIMNSRDICLIDYLQELADAGVCSFKVEGRSKTVNYLAGVGRAYRPALDAVEWGESYDAVALSREIFAISNRGYTPGFLVGNPEAKGIYFEKNAELKEEDFIGIVRGYNPETRLATVEVKNRFDIGETARVISPETSFEFVIEKIIGPDGSEKEAAHGGSFDVQILLPNPPGDYAILRKPLASS
jgi:putative protease